MASWKFATIALILANGALSAVPNLDNCNPSTGSCKDSSCTVFGFPNSARANCHTSGSNPNCPESYCNWVVPSCFQNANLHCYGYVACAPGTRNCYGEGELCLQDGNSFNFKVCAPSCKSDTNCASGETCNKALANPECQVQVGSFRAKVWEDSNQNGIQDGSEVGIPGVKVNLRKGLTVVASTTTNSYGQYSIENVQPDTYTIMVEKPSGYEFTRAVGGDSKIADFDQGSTASITLNSAQNYVKANVGLVPALNIAAQQTCSNVQTQLPKNYLTTTSAKVPSCSVKQAAEALQPYDLGCAIPSDGCDFIVCTSPIPEDVRSKMATLQC